ncbi:MAG TPA: hypothetical protein DEB46_06430 [Myxococcales bacterium]|nr:hypothetical protein [Myxococcales bacterium]
MVRLILSAFVALYSLQAMASEPRTKVIVNGSMAPVYFNDGDTFRVLSGALSGTKARLEGFNTLESFGPVHQWGTWAQRELYVNAKAATLFARRGIWRCSWDRRVDGYGRGLFKCPELAVHQIRAGFAHAMTVTADPSPDLYLEAQRDAIKHRRGMWAGGVPKYVLTSLHSVDEKPNQDWAYNRLVSTHDGHSERWIHRETYGECTNVCVDEVEIDSQTLRSAKAQLDTNDSLVAWRGLTARKQVEVFEIWLMVRTVSAHIPKPERDVMAAALTELVSSGLLTAANIRPGGCMIYTDYRRRFGGGKARCLKLER